MPASIPLFLRGRKWPPFSALVRGAAMWAALVLGSCSKERDTLPLGSDEVQGRDFYPVTLNEFWVYDVEDHTWDANTDSIRHYQLRETVDTVYRGASGEITYRIVRSIKLSSQPSWRDDSVFSVVVSERQVKRTSANVPAIELTFPVSEGRTWNPNALSTAVAATRSYENVDQPLTLPNGQQFARTVRVVDGGEDNVFYLRESMAAYARGVGRIMRTRRIYDYCQERDQRELGCLAGGGDYIVRGSERHEWLREHGTR